MVAGAGGGGSPPFGTPGAIGVAVGGGSSGEFVDGTGTTFCTGTNSGNGFGWRGSREMPPACATGLDVTLSGRRGTAVGSGGEGHDFTVSKFGDTD